MNNLSQSFQIQLNSAYKKQNNQMSLNFTDTEFNVVALSELDGTFY